MRKKTKLSLVLGVLLASICLCSCMAPIPLPIFINTEPRETHEEFLDRIERESQEDLVWANGLLCYSVY